MRKLLDPEAPPVETEQKRVTALNEVDISAGITANKAQAGDGDT